MEINQGVKPPFTTGLRRIIGYTSHHNLEKSLQKKLDLHAFSFKAAKSKISPGKMTLSSPGKNMYVPLMHMLNHHYSMFRFNNEAKYTRKKNLSDMHKVVCRSIIQAYTLENAKDDNRNDLLMRTYQRFKQVLTQSKETIWIERTHAKVVEEKAKRSLQSSQPSTQKSGDITENAKFLHWQADHPNATTTQTEPS